MQLENTYKSMLSKCTIENWTVHINFGSKLIKLKVQFATGY